MTPADRRTLLLTLVSDFRDLGQSPGSTSLHQALAARGVVTTARTVARDCDALVAAGLLVFDGPTPQGRGRGPGYRLA